MSRPEEISPPEIVSLDFRQIHTHLKQFYGDVEAQKYTANSRVQSVQSQMTHRALELLALPEDEASFVLDIGCGSGLSGEILDEEGHIWVGVDIAPSMLEVALEREVEGDLFLQDIGQGFGFRPGSFDGAISISVIQWLLNADSSSHLPPQRLAKFFTSLHSALRNPSRAVFQFYPSSDDQVQMITSAAQRAGFGGGLVVDYPNSKKARKMYLCLMVGQQEVPKGIEADAVEVERMREGVRNEKRRRKEDSLKRGKKKGKAEDNVKDWVLKKKDLYRTRGKEGVPRDSKYTARKRKTYF
ncbi:S-adenosyl-L-methionine-dependent methyltransferase [Kockovaella imperatae]|uniref:S-adenosyl-L-methionine-dependent methyltransferase n=1 Tax=Kockovaella imperatae TaxID=4999 RepID=A0A1Y1UFA9_9TREE|nr:S-adenosyl-L-methionine-dependent methyltransferase [Kockovaella imperatae]ORX36750.1 S-adenosyl-L-methionine-dependent methyltransferase [Kockovaella imperatae]